MSYEIKNRLSQPITCSLDDGSTFSLPPHSKKPLEDKQVNSYIKGLAEAKKVTLTKLENAPVVEDKASKSNKAQKREGGKDNGNTVET